MPSIFLRIFFLGIIAFLLYGWWVSDRARYFQSELGPQLREQYGFATGTPYIRSGDQSEEVLVIYPSTSGLMNRAGFREGDIILSSSLTEFYETLSETEGTASFLVTTGGDGPPLEKRKTRLININLIK